MKSGICTHIAYRANLYKHVIDFLVIASCINCRTGTLHYGLTVPIKISKTCINLLGGVGIVYHNLCNVSHALVEHFRLSLEVQHLRRVITLYTTYQQMQHSTSTYP